MSDKVALNENKRVVYFDNGDKLSLHDVYEMDLSGSYVRLKCRQGYVLINPDKVNAYIIDGEQVR